MYSIGLVSKYSLLVTHVPFVNCPVTLYGDHQIEYGGNKDRIHQHDSIMDALFSSAQSAPLCPRKEVPSLIPGFKSHPPDIYLDGTSIGLSMN